MRRLLLLHGHGGSPAGFDPLRDALAAITSPGAVTVEVVTPRGPVAVEDGWAWWGAEEDGPGPATLAAVADLARSATVVAGFSQGAAMALALGAGTSVVAVAGFLPGGGLRLLPAASLVVVHGERDEVVDPLHGRMVARRARAGGHEVREVWHPGGHQWPDAATAELARLMTAQLTVTSPARP